MPKTILLADDSVTIQKVVAISFASEDVTVLTVDNGDDAIVKAREVRPDIVLADVVMPGKSGYEVREVIGIHGRHWGEVGEWIGWIGHFFGKRKVEGLVAATAGVRGQ